MGSYESVSGFGSLGDEMSDLLSSATARPAAIQVTGSGTPGWGGGRPPAILAMPDWTTQTYVPPVYGKTTTARATPPLLITNTWRPPPVIATPPPVIGGQRPAMRPKVTYPPLPEEGVTAMPCPPCTTATVIPWIWIAVAVVVGGGLGYVAKQQMGKSPAKGAA